MPSQVIIIAKLYNTCSVVASKNLLSRGNLGTLIDLGVRVGVV